MDFSTFKTGDEFPLGQPGAMAGAIMFDFLIEEEESPYTRTNMLGLCPTELRAKPRRFDLSPSGGGARMPATPQGAHAASSDTAKILEAIQGVKTQVNGVETRLTKLEMPAAKQKGAQNRTVFFGKGDSEEDKYFEPPLPIQPPNPVRKGGLRIGEVRVRMAM